MSDGEQLLLLLSLIYLSGCLTWVDRRTIVFATWFGGAWKAVVANCCWGNSSGSVWMQNPLLPFGVAFTCRLLPVSISPSNIVVYNVQTIGDLGRPRQSRKVAQIVPRAKFSRCGSELHVDGQLFCDIGDAMTAHELVVLLNKIKTRDESMRTRAISDFWTGRLSVRRTKEAIRQMLSICRPLQMFSATIFGFLFLVLPVLAVQYNVGLTVLLGAVLLFVAAVVICFRYRACRARCCPALDVGFGGDFAKMILCPPTALRVTDLILMKLSARLDALPLAILLLRGESRERFLKRYLADLQTPDVPESLPEAVRETCLWQNRMIVQLVVTMVPGLSRFVNAMSRGETELVSEVKERESEDG
jgi:hypothetical protein